MSFVNIKDGKIFPGEWIDQNNKNTLQWPWYVRYSANNWKTY